ncbi:diacylglycerol kinase family lipid kinase [candidate division TA06 bacterium]|uniref:Diacylglycerol kinase family lipid kinase n=1 Tax=candidate division TA06 bacterium TaxID=2250710 RepID=A0A933I7U9_UNCT6|nr:diacylglycerol kinase family lipid kinase [candidate division TA06 bacterium]
MRIKVILNPKAHGGEAARHAEQIRSLFTAYGLNFELALTDHEGDGARLAREAIERGFQLIVAAGGDGLAGEVAGALVGGQALFGMIPLGSGDDFAKSLKIGRSIPQAVEAIRDRQTMMVDAGVVSSPLPGGKKLERYFFNCVGIGLDGEVIIEKQKIKGLRDLKLYLYATFKALLRYKGQRMSFDFGQGKIWHQALLAEITNGKSVGGGYYLNPDAKADDGLLDICLIHKLNWLEFFLHVPKTFKGKHTQLRQITMGKLTKVTVESDIPMSAQVDGELWPYVNRFDISIIPKALQAIVGKDDAGERLKSFS